MSSTHWSTVSTWSKAGVGTCIVLELKDPPPPPPPSSSLEDAILHHHQTPTTTSSRAGPRIVFDVGATPCFDDAIPAKYVFLSHGHIDHVGALFSHARAHAMTCGGAVATYFVPAPLMPQVELCRDAMAVLDASTSRHPPDADGEENKGGSRSKSLIDMKLVPVRAGDEMPLSGIKYGSKTSFFMRAFDVDHAGHPALGYVIGSRTTGGLKEEYRLLDGAQIRDLVKSGVSVMADPIEKIEVAYTGDTCARGLTKKRLGDDDNLHATTNEGGCKPPPFDIGQLFRAELLFCELTYLDSAEDETRQNVASKRGHLHINDIDGIFASHDTYREGGDISTNVASEGDGEKPMSIVFYHLSAKYRPACHALDLILEGLPSRLRDRCHVAISSLLSQEEKKSVEDSINKLIRPCGCISLAEYLQWKAALLPERS